MAVGRSVGYFLSGFLLWLRLLLTDCRAGCCVVVAGLVEFFGLAPFFFWRTGHFGRGKQMATQQDAPNLCVLKPGEYKITKEKKIEGFPAGSTAAEFRCGMRYTLIFAGVQRNQFRSGLLFWILKLLAFLLLGSICRSNSIFSALAAACGPSGVQCRCHRWCGGCSSSK